MIMTASTNKLDEPVFLVDDDEAFRKSTARLLKLSGYVVYDFASVGEFLMGFSQESKGCLLLDVRMPGSDGMDLLKHLKQEGVGNPVVFLTGHADVPLAVEAMRKGAFDLLAKPVEKQKLLDTVEKAISHGLRVRESEDSRSCLRERFQSLTPSEREIFKMVVDGLPNKAIAERMGNAERTVKLHRSSLSRKMGAQCVADLVRYYYEANIGGK